MWSYSPWGYLITRSGLLGAFSGFEIYDAYKKEHRTYAVDFAFLLEDLKGLPGGLSCKTTGSKTGVDPWCEVEGVKMNSTRGATVYLSAITRTPKDSTVRLQFRREFAEDKKVQKLWNADPPAERTSADAIASGRRCNGKHRDDEPFFDVSVFHCVIGWDVYYFSIYDLAHGLANNCKDVFGLVFNYGKMVFTEVKREFERGVLRRFADFTAKEKMPWQSSTKTKQDLSKLLLSGNLKFPTSWCSIFDPTKKAPTKITEKLMLAGDYGKWLLGLIGIDKHYYVSYICIWYGHGMVLVWSGYGLGMVWVWSGYDIGTYECQG
jgi:hypothetical protein